MNADKRYAFDKLTHCLKDGERSHSYMIGFAAGAHIKFDLFLHVLAKIATPIERGGKIYWRLKKTPIA